MDLNNLSANLTNITTTLTEKPSIATLATVLLSSAGFQDWLKLFLIGGVFETCRRTVFQAWDSIVDSFWITVDFEEGDDSYGENLAPPAGCSITAVTCRPYQPLTMLIIHYSYRLDDGLAFATSSLGQGEETCHQHLVIWTGNRSR